MGHSAAGGAVQASRQKNCTACVQAKRRCDRRTPICKRCADKNINCVYARTSVATSSHTPEAANALPAYMDMNTDDLQFGGSTPSPFSFSPGPSLDIDYLNFMPMDSQTLASASLSLDPSALDAADTDNHPMDPFMDMLNDSIDPNLHRSLVSADRGSTIDRPYSPADEGTLTAYNKMAPICVSPVEPSDPQQPSSSLSFCFHHSVPVSIV